MTSRSGILGNAVPDWAKMSMLGRRDAEEDVEAPVSILEDDAIKVVSIDMLTNRHREL
jgi:hypothetical protein